jgi:hypothetical protein
MENENKETTNTQKMQRTRENDTEKNDTEKNETKQNETNQNKNTVKNKEENYDENDLYPALDDGDITNENNRMNNQ